MRTETKLVAFIVAIAFVVSLVARVGIVYDLELRGDSYCEMMYGEGYWYSTASNTELAGEIDTCSAISKDGNLTIKYTSKNHIKRSCHRPSFLDLRDWGVECTKGEQDEEEMVK